MDEEQNSASRRVSLPQPRDTEKIARILDRAAPPAKADPATTTAAPPSASQASPQQKEWEQKIIKALRKVFDPEIPVNLYDLGLIYAIDIAPSNDVKIRMTLTAPGCPVAGSLVTQVRENVAAVPGVSSVQVELVWEPPWNREMMSEAARLELGML